MAIIIGDLNVDLNCMTYDVSALLDFCISNRLFIVPYNSIYHMSFFYSWIDYCFNSAYSFSTTIILSLSYPCMIS